MNLLSLSVAAAILTVGVSAQAQPTLAGCPAFPANSIFNTPIDTMPVDPHSTDYINAISATTGLRWDASIPYNVVPGTQPLVPLIISAIDESDPGPYPIPPNAAIESGSDQHVLVVDKDHCIIYETDGASPNADGSWSVYSAAKWSLLSNALRPAYWTSADAAGLPMTNLLLRYDEILAGEIKHAIRFTAPQTQRLFIWPARHYASTNTSALLPPMGQRFRLKANFDISGFSPTNQIILKAMKKYGIILADNGMPWFFQLASDSRWNGSDLDNLRWGTVGSNFEAVDESSLMIDPNSGAAVQPNAVAALSSISVSPSTVTGGASVSVTVNLTAAPTSGAVVTLTGSNAAFPTASVTVSAGLLTQTFSVPTVAVSVSTAVTITASYNGASATASLTVNPAATSGGGFAPIRVNAGGGAYTDSSGNTWSADTGYIGGYGYSTSSTVANTTASPLYQAERYSPGSVQYAFAAPNGTYTVNLKFAEIYFTTCGQRVFNVAINGSTLDTNFDPCAAAGGAFRAVDRSYTVNVTGGAISIALNAVVENPAISGIEILSGGSSTPAPPPATGFTPIRINAGGAAYTDPSGNVWAADTNPVGYSYSTGAGIGNTTTTPLYQTERWNSTTLQYAFSVPNATYTVKLKFAEIYFTSCGHRIFNVSINGATLDANFDPCAAGGGPNMAADRSYSVTVNGGQIAISLIPVLDTPTVSAIEITSGSTAPAPPPPTSGFTPIRVNAGGPGYTDSSGNVWAADTNPTGYVFSTGLPIGNTTAVPLYQTERWYTAPLQYSFSVPNATYTVTLRFAEIYFTSCGHRIFNVAINGATVDANFDPCAAGGGPNLAADRSYTVTVSGGQIAITLTPVVDNPTISAIEIQ